MTCTSEDPAWMQEPIAAAVVAAAWEHANFLPTVERLPDAAAAVVTARMVGVALVAICSMIAEQLISIAGWVAASRQETAAAAAVAGWTQFAEPVAAEKWDRVVSSFAGAVVASSEGRVVEEVVVAVAAVMSAGVAVAVIAGSVEFESEKLGVVVVVVAAAELFAGAVWILIAAFVVK